MWNRTYGVIEGNHSSVVESDFGTLYMMEWIYKLGFFLCSYQCYIKGGEALVYETKNYR